MVTTFTARSTIKFLRTAHTVYLCPLYVSQNKQWLFLNTALTGWFLLRRRRVFTARYELTQNIIHVKSREENQLDAIDCFIELIICS